MNGWIKAFPEREKSQIWMCPYCGQAVYQAFKKTAGGQCEYRYCPHCREQVIKGADGE
jgi:hypothetical protein